MMMMITIQVGICYGLKEQLQVGGGCQMAEKNEILLIWKLMNLNMIKNLFSFCQIHTQTIKAGKNWLKSTALTEQFV